MSTQASTFEVKVALRLRLEAISKLSLKAAGADEPFARASPIPPLQVQCEHQSSNSSFCLYGAAWAVQYDAQTNIHYLINYVVALKGVMTWL